MACATQLADLLSRCALGDRRAFERLYRETSGMMFAVALGIVKDRTLAGDVLQESYVKVWTRADSFDPDQANPTTWIGAIVRHQAIDTLRRRACRPGCQAEKPELDQLVCSELGPLELACRDRQAQRVRACLAQLPEQQRQALTLAFFHGLTHEEVAQYMDVPLGTGKSWVRQGLKRLRTMLEEPAVAPLPVPTPRVPPRPAPDPARVVPSGLPRAGRNVDFRVIMSA